MNAERMRKLKERGPIFAWLGVGAINTGAALLVKAPPGEIGQQGAALVVRALENIPIITSATDAQTALSYAGVISLLTAGATTLARRGLGR